MSRFARSSYTFLVNLLLTVVTTLTGFIATPLLIAWLGKEKFGASRTLTDWFGYVGLLEMGLAGALLPVMSMSLPREGGRGVLAVLHEALRIYRRVAMSMIVTGAILAFAMPWLISTHESSRRDLALAAFVLVPGMAFVLAQPFRSILDASQRSYLIGYVLIGQSLVTTITCVIAAASGLGIFGQAVGTLLGNLVYFTATYVTARRFFPHTPHSTPSPDERSEIRARLLQHNRPLFAASICSRLAFFTDNILIGHIIGAASVTPFFVTQRLVQMAYQQLGAIGTSTWAAMAELYHAGQTELFEHRVMEATRVLTIFSFVLLTPIVVCNRWFVTFWIDESAYGGDALTLFAGANAVILSLLSYWGWLLVGTGKTSRLMGFTLTGTIVNVVVSVAGTYRFHILGPVLGTFVAFALVQFWWVPLILRKELSISLRKLVHAVLPPAAMGLTYFAGCWWVVHRYPPRGWLTLLPMMAAQSAVFAVAAYFLLLDRDQRAVWATRLRILRGPRS